MIVSIETPVFKGRRLQRCIDSVLYQSSPHWHYTLLWDGGDEESRMILESLQRRNLRNVTVHFAENRGIARARRFLTENSAGEFILPLDDDDALPFNAVERFLAVAEERPWASVIRAQRSIIDDDGVVLDTPPWFPFEPRHYQGGMVTDVFNHTHPYLIRRTAYDRTAGWEGFEDFGYAGEDCDIFLKLEEVGPIELVDEVLYYYRVHDERASLVLTDEAAFEMWRRLADRTVARIGLPLRRTNDEQPFEYEQLPKSPVGVDAMDVVVVKDDRTSKLALNRITKALRKSGVPKEHVHVIDREGAGHLNAAFAATESAAVCLIDASIQWADVEALPALLATMSEEGADLAGPKLVNKDGFIVGATGGLQDDLTPHDPAEGQWDEGQYDRVQPAHWLSEKLALVRREVVNAVGGFDEEYESDRVAWIDFCTRARQRDFRCRFLGTHQFVLGRTQTIDAEADFDRFRRKWATYANTLYPAGTPT